MPQVFCAVLLLASFSLSSCAGPAAERASAGAAETTIGSPARPPSVSMTTEEPSTWVREENARPGTDDWRIPNSRIADDDELAGYAGAVGVHPGDAVDLMISSSLGEVVVHAYRLGHYGGAGAREVWRSDPLEGTVQPPATVDAERMVRADWDASVTVDTTGWPPGSYLFRLTGDGRSTYVPLTVVSPDVTDRLVIVSAVTTYAAYNTWGGHSLYYDSETRGFDGRALRVSFDRPYDGVGAKTLLQYEQGVIRLAEEAGVPVAYLTSLELDSDPDALVGAAGVVSTGHDEYWTQGMRTAVERARDTGTNVAFLGANAVYWRVRLEEGGRVVAGYKEAGLDPVRDAPTTTVRWRDAPHPDPESSLVGMLYECFPAAGPFVVLDPGFWGFAEAEVRAGDSFPGLVGTEIDRAYPGYGTPENLQVVAHSPVECASVGRTHADMTYYTVRSGAGVVSTGTMLWTIALRGESERHGLGPESVAFARTVTRTILREMAEGPLGGRYPAQANLAHIDPPATTRTGTGGPVAEVG